jgi:hypothetical protein
VKLNVFVLTNNTKRMKILYGFVFMLCICGLYPAQAQYDTGDTDLDKTLLTLDTEANISYRAFKANISRKYNVSASKLEYLTVDIGMTAGDIYLTMEIARITNKSVNQVVEAYQNSREKGWGVIAVELGIQPGSNEFEELKNRLKSRA